jgi:hypothetical protein
MQRKKINRIESSIAVSSRYNELPAADLKNGKVKYMLYTIAVILAILWLLGLVTSYTLGGVIHVLLVVAIVMVLISFFTGRRRA